MSNQVKVEISDIADHRDPPGVAIHYRVRNENAAPIWMVNDRWIIWRQEASRIEVSLARGRMRPGTTVFGYFPPAVLKIESGNSVSDALTLDWPLRLDRLWNELSEVAPAPGRYELVLRIGYGLTSSPGELRAGDEVEDPVLRWQMEAASDPFPLDIGEYQPQV